MTERRTFNTPLREPLNPIIYRLLQAVDWHNKQYFQDLNPWHLEQASILRTYVSSLKDWIHGEENKTVASVGEGPGEQGE